jgi:hypothetical protein
MGTHLVVSTMGLSKGTVLANHRNGNNRVNVPMVYFSCVSEYTTLHFTSKKEMLNKGDQTLDPPQGRP